MSYPKSGYGPGAPRIGEIRPLSMTAIVKQKSRDKIRKEMGEEAYLKMISIQSKLYYLANPEKYRAYARASYYRRKARMEQKAILLVR